MANWITSGELQTLTGRTRQAIHEAVKRGNLVRDETTGKYDAHHTSNIAWIERARAATGMSEESGEDDSDNQGLRNLSREKLLAEIDRIRRQVKSLEIDNARKLQEMIPADIMRQGFGLWAAAIKNNVLTLGSRIARDDPQLRARIDRETERAIKAALDYTARGLREWINREFAEGVENVAQEHTDRPD